jgi:hypothetical protein
MSFESLMGASQRLIVSERPPLVAYHKDTAGLHFLDYT